MIIINNNYNKYKKLYYAYTIEIFSYVNNRL